MTNETCLIHGCPHRVYAPAGTSQLCKEHFLSFVTWRRRKGSAMFHKYAALTMEERNAILAEWSKTVLTE